MKLKKIHPLLVVLALVWACKNGTGAESTNKITDTRNEVTATSGAPETPPKQFPYSKEEASQYIKKWIDSAEAKKDLPKIKEEQVAGDLFAFYSKRDFKPAWNMNTTQELVSLLQNIDQEGLNPDVYPLQELQSLMGTVSNKEAGAEAGASLDVLLSASYLKLAKLIATGKVKPGKFSNSWHIKPTVPDTFYPHLQRAVEGNVDASLDYFRPRFAQYEKLQQHLQTYSKIVEEGGWPKVEAGAELVPGDSSQRLPAIRKRLYVSGDLQAAPDDWQQPAVYDSAFIRAVNKYQARNGLEVQAAITDKMVEAMNVPAGMRLKQIMLNLDRIRWFSSGDMPKTYVLVNIPEYRLHVFEEGRAIKQMKVVVGKVMNSTPIFSDKIEYVDFSPYWNVPTSIAMEELWPKIKADLGYVDRHHYEILDGWGQRGQVVSLSSVDWSNLESYRIRQKPGPWNALGRVKFMFPNDFAIYLHDTPANQLFDKTHRAFSHGCIRVEDPAWFADWLLPQLNLQDVKRKMNNNQREVVQLEEELPVYIFYLTAFEGEDGQLNFREDLYKLDKRLTPEFDNLI